MTRKHPARVVAAAAASAALLTSFCATALAIDRSWNVNSGNWGSSGNWNPAAVPTSNDIVTVAFFNGAPGVVSVTQPQTAPISLSIFNDNRVSVTGSLVAGSLGVGGDLFVGRGGTHGTLTVLGPNPGITVYTGQVSVGNTMRIGYDAGIGTVTQNDGTVTVTQLLRIGDRNGGSKFAANGTYSLSGVGVLHVGRLEVGYGGQTSQFPNTFGTFSLGGNGRLNISLAIPEPHIGGNGSTGVFNQTGGTLSSPDRIISVGGGAGSGVYNYSGGSVSIAGMALLGTNATANFNGGTNLSLGQVTTVNGRINLAPSGTKVLRTTLLNTSPGVWKIDLTNNGQIADAALGETILAAVIRGRAGGSWTGNGITSSTAASTPLHSLAVLRGVEYRSVYGPTAVFGNVTVTDNQTIVKYTRNGDTDLNGVVNFDDYARTDAGFLNGRTGWFNGDFNYSGNVNFDDYALIDAAFLSQSPGAVSRAVAWLGGDAGVDMTSDPSLAKVAQHADQFAGDYTSALLRAIPEPAGVTVCALAMAALAQRRRRARRPIA